MRRYRAAWRHFWSPPKGPLLPAGRAGEILISWLRVVGGLVALALFGIATLRHPGEPRPDILLVLAAAAPVFALGVLFLLRRVTYDWWFGFASSLGDVTVINATILLLHGREHEGVALGPEIGLPLLLLAVAATSLRLDHRACAAATGVAVFEYGVVAWIVASGSSSATAGLLDPEMFAARLLLLTAVGVVATLGSLRMQRPHLLSANDALTGLLNRRAFEERWDGEVARSRRHGRPISVLAIDIDYFKQFNDHYGHAAGDTALRVVARAIRGRVRRGDFVARMGGEEFVVALPETPSVNALAIAEALRTAVAAAPIPISGERTPAGVTVSVGVASWPEHGEELSRLLERADKRLYEAKLAGRDQVKGPEPRLLERRPVSL
ncbi:MAG: GGDEF domain-containing protein [Gemmatimonadota bacterium]|nr:GGDEF domain-containing protein [Gemmatimonadota bacterium]